MRVLIQNLLFAFRQMVKRPGFTAVVVLTMALGIGANAAIFSVLDAILLRPLPYDHPEQLIKVWSRFAGIGLPNDQNWVSAPEFRDFQQLNRSFSDLAAIGSGSVNLGVKGSPQRVVGASVSPSLFPMLGVQPLIGRSFLSEEAQPGRDHEVVLSYGLWRRVFAASPNVVGSTIDIDGVPMSVVGVMPAGFAYPDQTEIWGPLAFSPDDLSENNRGSHGLEVLGRIKPGLSFAQVKSDMDRVAKTMIEQHQSYPYDKFGFGIILHPLLEETVGDVKTSLLLLMAAVGVVLLIACANIANLLLARGMARKAEMSLRTALGAARTRIVRQLLTESLVLAVIGGISALAVSYGGAELLLKLAFPSSNDVPIHATPSLIVQGFAIALSLVTGVLFGVAPAWLSASAQPADALRSGSRTTAGGASVLQRVLVVMQAALSLVLLVGAGLFAQSLSKLEHFDMKLDAANRYIIHFDPQSAGYSQAQLATLYRTIEDRFHQIPGMVKVGLSTYTPMEAYNDNMSVQIQGQPNLYKSSSYVWANSEYFDSVGTHVVMGRGFGPQDSPTAPAAAVVNQAFVKTFFKPGENPIGAHLGRPESPSDFTIVGVVQDTTYGSVGWKDHSMFFLRLLQQPAGDKKPTDYVFVNAIVLEAARPKDNLEALSRHTLSSINPNLSVEKFQTFSSQIGEQFTHARMLSRLMTLFGGLALLLAAVGLYGVTAYGVERRTSEISIRMALGAERSGVVAMILRSALLQTAIGLAIGVPVAFYGVTLVKSQLYEMTTVSGGALAMAVGTLLAAACVAGLIPARRAASVDPAQALRTE